MIMQIQNSNKIIKIRNEKKKDLFFFKQEYLYIYIYFYLLYYFLLYFILILLEFIITMIEHHCYAVTIHLLHH